MRIIRLDEGTFFAVVVVEGESGRTEADARPSDALNLALVSGAPIRVARAIFDYPEATSQRAWQRVSTRQSDLVAEELQDRGTSRMSGWGREM